MSFGWSVGDIVASITLLVKIGGALKETGGASSDYQESIEFLFGLEITLQNLQSIAPVLLSSSQQSILQLEIEKIAKPIATFFDRVQKLDKSLGKESKKALWRTAPRKIQWALQVSKEVKALRDSISVPIASLNIIIQSQILLAMSNLHEKLPQDVADKLASRMDHVTDISSGLREEIISLKESVKSYEQTQSNLKQDMVITVENATSRESHTLMALRQQIDRLPQEVSQRVLTESKENSRISSRFEQLMVEQSHDLKMICGSLTTMTECQKAAWSNNSEELTISSHVAFAELKSAFCKCIYLLAMSIRQFFNEAMLYLGPQFLLFLLAFKQLGIQAPRLLLGDRFLFEDVLGRQKFLPVEFFQHYTVFSSFLQESFDGLPGQRYVANRQFRLTDGRSNIIRSESWRKTIVRRPKVSMTVVLDAVVDELVDGLACPRCSTSETFAQPNMSVECSSCRLNYRTATRTVKMLDKNREETGLLPEETAEPILPAISTQSPGLASFEPVQDDSEEFGEATVTDMSSANMNRRLRASNQMPRQGDTLWELPWDEEELMHFKRVQIPDFEIQETLSDASTLERIALALESIVARSGDLKLTHARGVPSDIFLFLKSQLTRYALQISVISNHPAVNLLPKEVQSEELDWTTDLSTTACKDLEDLAVDGRKLLKAFMSLYHDLKNYDRMYKSFEKKIDERTTLVSVGIGRSASLRVLLEYLLILDDGWKHGGLVSTRAISQRDTQEEDLGELDDDANNSAATSFEVTGKYIILGLDTAYIWVFDNYGVPLRRLLGHVMGVWTLAARGETLVSGAADRDLRVWKLNTGECLHVLRGHTSTVRSLGFIDENRVVSGSRDTTLRIWDIREGVCMIVLVGHQASVRCLAVTGNLIVSGSYDSTARVWSINTGRCLRTLSGHFSEIYCIAADSKRVVTGSLDTSIRIWNIQTGVCQAILQGHTSLVGHIQLRGNTLVSGGSDGKVRVWSLLNMAPIHRIAAADNSITGLQFDHNRIITGSSDGRVRVWDLATGAMIRELGDPSKVVWRIHMSESMAVVIKSREDKMLLDVWSFQDKKPQPEEPDLWSTPVSKVH